MTKLPPHWHPDPVFSTGAFFIRRMDTQGFAKPERLPGAGLPLVAFVYLTQGEVLVEAANKAFLCCAGHLLLIPPHCTFSILHYADAVGYTGAFSPDKLHLLAWSRFAALREPVWQAFWFDEGSFVGELFNMFVCSYERGDMLFIEKGLDLLLSRVRMTEGDRMPDAVRSFLEMLFASGSPFMALEGYAGSLGISANYLSRLVVKHTGKTAGDWIDISRIGKAKELLANTSEPIIDVAVAVGLEDQSYFARYFRRHTGMTPSEYRKEMQG